MIFTISYVCFEDKKCYITNLSLMGEINPWVLLNGARFGVTSITELSDFKVTDSWLNIHQA